MLFLMIGRIGGERVLCSFIALYSGIILLTIKDKKVFIILSMKKNIKICFVSSSGGHWEELMCLKKLMNQYQSFYVTEYGGQMQDSKCSSIYGVKKIDRSEKYFLIHFVALFFRSFKIYLKEKPDVVITTGALAAYPICLISKLFRKKIIYIESFARVNSKSLTGKLIYPISDLFLVQWEEMLQFSPKAKYVGGIF